MATIERLLTLSRLGPLNLLRVARYRLLLKAGWHSVQRLSPAPIATDAIFFRPADGDLQLARLPPANTDFNLFGWFECNSEPQPDWHLNPMNGVRSQNQHTDWWQIPDFDAGLGDIKCVWEASRFDWLPQLAQRGAQNDEAAISQINNWLAHWLENNPPYKGVNWKCGQEASFRVMNLALTARLLGQIECPEADLMALIKLLLHRIAPTLSYARAQDNNHGTSEAAALFIGGSWLQQHGDLNGERWMRVGRKRLVERVSSLVMADGSFSQYSVNYHRLMLDTLSLCECWRRWLGLPDFGAEFNSRASAATKWLYAHVDSANGDAPNLGANDGAHILRLSGSDYRDYRPSVALASALFLGKAAFSGVDVADLQLNWLGMQAPTLRIDKGESRVFNEGGFSLLTNGKQRCYLRFPRFRFRPSQADLLHVDFWSGPVNLLRDAGTYSYNCEPELLDYFPGTAAHNTIQFDGRDQMPRVSRFLFGGWLKAEAEPRVEQSEAAVSISTAITDAAGCRHERKVELHDDYFMVVDIISGSFNSAVLRWRLAPAEWSLSEAEISSHYGKAQITSTLRPVRSELTSGLESRYYLNKTSLPVWEYEVNQACTIRSQFNFSIK